MKVYTTFLVFMSKEYMKHPLWWFGLWLLPTEMAKVDEVIFRFIRDYGNTS